MEIAELSWAETEAFIIEWVDLKSPVRISAVPFSQLDATRLKYQAGALKSNRAQERRRH
jgi:hypothetical protein